jgi:hypothetical protein
MSTAADMSRLPDWPRMLALPDACAYVGGVSENHFKDHIPVKPIRMGRRVLYDRNAIDEYLDTIQGRGGGTSWAEQCELP